MNIDDFLKRAQEELRCADLGNEKEAAQILETFVEPLHKKYTFSFEHDGAVELRLEISTQVKGVVEMPLNEKHRSVYLRRVAQKLKHYRELVEHNNAVNPSYQRPTFELEQAEEYVREALQDSFGVVRKSYWKQTK